jgi:hypothetical protein
MGVYNMVFEDEHETSESETETVPSSVIHVNSNGRTPAIVKLSPIWAILIAEGIFILAPIPIPFVSPILAIAFLVYYFSYKKDIRNHMAGVVGALAIGIPMSVSFILSWALGSDYIGLIMWGLLVMGGFVGGYLLFSFASKRAKRR